MEEAMNASGRRDGEQPEALESTSEIQSLLRLLVREVNRSPCPVKPRQLDGGAREIILDTDVDGIRCLLVRTAQSEQRHQALSPREQAIARMVAEGYPNKSIAAILDISIWTVSTHLRRVFAKLGVGSRAAMVAHLIESGLLAEHLDQAPATSSLKLRTSTELTYQERTVRRSS